jgi:hypothetical protein
MLRLKNYSSPPQQPTGDQFVSGGKAEKGGNVKGKRINENEERT